MDYENSGEKIPQTSNPLIISSMLNLLEVNEGDSVLEIGTGSGYSTALLASLVGSSGNIVSIDIVPELVTRASTIFNKQGLDFVKIVQGDGRKGAINEAPYDRIIAWATGEFISSDLIEQLSSDGIIIAPINLFPLLSTTVIVRLKKSNGSLIGEKVIPGGFVNLSNEPQQQWMGPFDCADILLTNNKEPYLGISSQWLKDLELKDRTKYIHKLFSVNISHENLFNSDEDINDFKVFLLAKNPDGLTTMFSKEYGSTFGFSESKGLALVSLRTKKCIYNGNPSSLDILKDWIKDWRNSGQPGYEQLIPYVEKTNNGWRISLKL
jgi:protein-L-isoaspartate(D-aspartate) O-methyltransferase